MKVGLGTVSLNIVLSIILAHFMGLKGVVLATAIANTLTSAVTMYIFNRTKIQIHLGRFVKSGGMILGASVAGMLVAIFWIRSGIIENYILLFITSACLDFGIYGVLMLVVKNEIAMEMLSIGKEIIGKRKS